jgi:hypothetical protein
MKKERWGKKWSQVWNSRKKKKRLVSE